MSYRPPVTGSVCPVMSRQRSSVVLGSAAEVTPVASAGPWNFEVGDVTMQLRKDYLDLVNRRLAIVER